MFSFIIREPVSYTHLDVYKRQGFDRTRLGGYLDLFWVMMNPPRDKMEKAAFVLDLSLIHI